MGVLRLSQKTFIWLFSAQGSCQGLFEKCKWKWKVPYACMVKMNLCLHGKDEEAKKSPIDDTKSEKDVLCENI